MYVPKNKYFIKETYTQKQYYNDLQVFMKNITSGQSIEGYHIDFDFGKNITFKRIEPIDQEFDEFLFLMASYLCAAIFLVFFIRRILKFKNTNRRLKKSYSIK